MGAYFRPRTLPDALTALEQTAWLVVAGCTDVFPAHVGRPVVGNVLDVTGIDALRGIDTQDGQHRIGALASWTDVIEASLPASFDGLKQAALQVGGVQVRNVATVVGNLCNASPAADGVPPLLTLNACVELRSTSGTRRLALGDFITGNRHTLRRRDELVTALLIPQAAPQARSCFAKLGARDQLVIAIVCVGMLLEPGSDGTVSDARIAVGACSKVATRLPALEALLVGRPLDARLGEVVTLAHLSNMLSPIDDVRGSAAYRLQAATTLVQRNLCALGTA